jgi:hypothetical protein
MFLSNSLEVIYGRADIFEFLAVAAQLDASYVIRAAQEQ